MALENAKLSRVNKKQTIKIS